MLLATKMLRDFMIARHVTPCNFACNLCRNKIARQVATKVAWCNSAFRNKITNFSLGSKIHESYILAELIVSQDRRIINRISFLFAALIKLRGGNMRF